MSDNPPDDCPHEIILIFGQNDSEKITNYMYGARNTYYSNYVTRRILCMIFWDSNVSKCDE